MQNLIHVQSKRDSRNPQFMTIGQALKALGMPREEYVPRGSLGEGTVGFWEHNRDSLEYLYALARKCWKRKLLAVPKLEQSTVAPEDLAVATWLNQVMDRITHFFQVRGVVARQEENGSRELAAEAKADLFHVEQSRDAKRVANQRRRDRIRAAVLDKLEDVINPHLPTCSPVARGLLLILLEERGKISAVARRAKMTPYAITNVLAGEGLEIRALRRSAIRTANLPFLVPSRRKALNLPPVGGKLAA